jgi:hypothetical protein
LEPLGTTQLDINRVEVGSEPCHFESSGERLRGSEMSLSVREKSEDAR